MLVKILEPLPAIDPDLLDYLQDNGHRVIRYEEDIDPHDVDAIVVRSNVVVDATLLKKYNTIAYVLRIGVGTDKIDTDLLAERNIKLINTPGANAQSVASLALRGILSLLRNTHKNRNTLDDRYAMMGDDLTGKVIWLVWFGHIAKKLYALINAFGDNRFLVYDPYINPDTLTDENIAYVKDKADLFRDSDILSFHIPLTSETKDFLGWEDFNVLKDSIKIINTARWGVVNEDDLVRFLSTHPDAGAYIDTWADEPENPSPSLQALDNIIITPHLWAMTQQSNRNMHRFQL